VGSWFACCKTGEFPSQAQQERRSAKVEQAQRAHQRLWGISHDGEEDQGQ